ncbi:IclR family transcriptional regulator [Pararhodobacter marinus]|uniref:IclR family transcriptional regulator n=1 Tax=Pararhodobacter marinus TaxID=2184063 RepID=UPI00143DE651|nr:helix-turn-helix domain-containing protein [Pararhodobacter marinus]
MDRTLLKGLDVFERVIAADGPVQIADLVRETGLPKSNIHRTLSTLVAAGYVLHDPVERRYSASLKVALLGQRVTTRTRYREALLPHLEDLARRTEETASFALPSGAGIVIIANALPPRSLAAILPDSQTFAPEDTAFGLALDPGAPRDPAHGAYGLITDHPQRHTFEIALPLSPDANPALGAIGLVGPASRYGDERLPPLLGALAGLRAGAFAGNNPSLGSPEHAA